MCKRLFFIYLLNRVCVLFILKNNSSDNLTSLLFLDFIKHVILLTIDSNIKYLVCDRSFDDL